MEFILFTLRELVLIFVDTTFDIVEFVTAKDPAEIVNILATPILAILVTVRELIVWVTEIIFVLVILVILALVLVIFVFCKFPTVPFGVDINVWEFILFTFNVPELKFVNIPLLLINYLIQDFHLM